MDQPRALDAAVEDLATARALIATLQEQLTTSQREIASLRHQPAQKGDTALPFLLLTR